MLFCNCSKNEDAVCCLLCQTGDEIGGSGEDKEIISYYISHEIGGVNYWFLMKFGLKFDYAGSGY